MAVQFKFWNDITSPAPDVVKVKATMIPPGWVCGEGVNCFAVRVIASALDQVSVLKVHPASGI